MPDKLIKGMFEILAGLYITGLVNKASTEIITKSKGVQE